MSNKPSKSTTENEFFGEVFNDFSDYWHFARFMTLSQRDIITGSLSQQERNSISKSFKKGGWFDLIIRDELDHFVDEIQQKYGINLIETRCKVLKKKSLYISKKLWDEIQNRLEDKIDRHKNFLVGGIKGISCKSNPDMILLLRQDSNVED